MADLQLRVSYEEPGGDVAGADEALRSLAQELDLVRGAHVEPAAEPRSLPPGSRGIDAASICAVLVSIPAAITAVQSLAAHSVKE